MKQAFPLLSLLAALCMYGCASQGFDLDMNPIFRNLEHAEFDSTDTDALIPFFFKRRTPEMTDWGLRPLYGSRSYPDRSRKELDFLPPFGRAVAEPDRTTVRFWPLYRYTRTRLSGKGEDVDWVLFPILYGGHSDEGENYFAFFPLGGRIRHFLGYECFDFALWPLYQRIEKAMVEENCVSHSILLLVAWTTGGKRDGSYRILPFYMHRKWEGKYDKYSVLWPFFHYQKNRLDTKNPSTLHAFWPLYTYESSNIHSQLGLIGPVFFLGPLIQVASETPEEWEGQPNVDNRSYYHYDVPWPLVRVHKKRDSEYLLVFPFYSHFQEPGFDSKAYMIPFFWHRQEQTDKYAREDYYLVPFFHSKHKVYVQGGEDSLLQIWPFFHSASGADGSRDFGVLSLLPSGLETFIEPIDRLFWPFWNLYRYRRDESGAVRHDALLGLISAYSAQEEFRFSFPLLYSYHQTQELPWRHDLLLGLISVGGDSEGLKKFRFLFIPFLDS